MMKNKKVIGIGRYRTSYSVDGDICIKEVNKELSKKIFGLEFKLDTKSYLKNIYGIENLNEFEYNIFKELPTEFKEFLPSFTEIGAGDILYQELIKDYTGDKSINLKEFGKIRNDYFWNKIHYLKFLFEKNNLYFYDVFSYGNNIIVKRIAENKYQPIIIDLKRIGTKMNKIQPLAYFEFGRNYKFQSRFKRFKENFFK